MSGYYGDINPAEVIEWRDYSAVNGVLTDLAGSPAVSIYKTNSDTESTAGVTFTVTSDSRTGFYKLKIDTSADGTFYATANDFQAVLTTGTLGGISQVGVVLGTFSIQNRSPLRPTTANRTLLVSSGGAADSNLVSILGTALTETAGQIAAAFKKFFNIATPAATMDHLVLVDTVTTATTATNLTNAPTAGDLTAAMKASVTAAVPTAASIATAVWAVLTSALTTVGSIGKLLVDNIDAAITSRLASASYTAPDNTSITAIKAKTDNLPASPAATSDIPTAVQNADALLGRNIAGGSSAGRLVKDALRFLRNKWSISGNTLTVCQEDDTTTAWTGTVSTDSTADPVIGNDPA